MAASLGAGAILMTTETKSHWLAIEYQQGDAKQSTVLQLDKSEYENVIATLEARTGKHIAVLDSKTSSLNPTAESKDMDEVIPFGMDKVVAALKPALESMGCKVTHAKATRIECKRDRGYSERPRTSLAWPLGYVYPPNRWSLVGAGFKPRAPN